MCDKEHYEDLDDRVTALEKNNAVLDARFDSLLKSTNNLKHVVYAFTFLLLLTVIYGAIGGKGFNAVTTAAAKTHASSNPINLN